MEVEGKLLYRPEEAAEHLGISRARLYELMGRGEIRSVKIGASRRVPARDLRAFVEHLRSLDGEDLSEPAEQIAANAD